MSLLRGDLRCGARSIGAGSELHRGLSGLLSADRIQSRGLISRGTRVHVRVQRTDEIGSVRAVQPAPDPGSATAAIYEGNLASNSGKYWEMSVMSKRRRMASFGSRSSRNRKAASTHWSGLQD